MLGIPCSKLKSHGDQAFSASAPKLWNDIPETIKCSTDLTFSSVILNLTFLSVISMNNVYLLFLTFNLDCKSALELLDRALLKLSTLLSLLLLLLLYLLDTELS